MLCLVLIRKGFRYRIYPTAEQAARLRQWEGTLRWLWNLAHEQRLMGLAHCRGEQKFYTAFDQINELTELRAELPWLADVPRDVCAQLLVELDMAWQRCFRRLAMQPRWKSKGRDAVNPCAPQGFRIDGTALVFPKIGRVPLVLHRPLEGKAKTATITHELDQWFVSVSCEVEIAESIQRPSIVAVDRGVVNLTADSNGRIEPNPQFLKRQAKRLARAQRRVAKSRKGSASRKKRIERVARLFRKVRRQRDHVLHRVSNHYAKNHSHVIVEMLQVRNMIASARGTVEEPGTNVRQKAGLNRSILDAGWGRLVGQLRYKLAWAGGRLEEVPAAYSSQTCAACGVVDAASRRNQSEFECVACGHKDHADVNAAKVLYSRRSDGGAVCGGYPIAGPAKQKLRVVRRGTQHARRGSSKAPAFMPG